MRFTVERRCEQHPDPYDCPDNLVAFVAKSRTYGLIVHDGGTSYVEIAHCPWCGARLPPRANGPDGSPPAGAVPIA